MIRPKYFIPALTSLSLALAFGGCAGQADSAGDPNNTGGNVGFGGAQDFGQFRDILDQGLIPGSATLDANGFFNEHYTELPPADCGQALCLHGMASVNPAWSDSASDVVLRVALNTTIQPEDLQDKPRDLIVVVDTSGSMAEDDRMSFVKQGMDLLIDELAEGDRIGIVSYASEGLVQAELGALDKVQLHDVVAGLQSDGGTNIYGGLELGMQMAATNLSAERQSRVILLSDGNITAGPGPTEVQDLSETYVADGIGLTTIGVGNDFNLDLMKGLAETGSGNFYYVESPDAVTEVFTEELAYFAQPIALDLQVAVQSSDSYSLGEVVGTRLWKHDETEPGVDPGNYADSGSLYVPALFLSSRSDTEPGESGRRGGGSSIYLELSRSGSAIGDSFATVTASFRLPGSDEVITQEIVIANPVGEGLPEGGFVSHIEMLKAHAVYNFFMGLRQACEQAESDYAASLATIQELRINALEWNERVPDADISEDLALLDQFETNLNGEGFEDGYGEDGYGGYDDIDNDPSLQMCSASGTGFGGLGFAFLLLASMMRLRRRSN
jgi:Ca-activated chloride channel family protein